MLSRRSEIARLIWDVETFHGLTLVAKVPGDPDDAINCSFEDIEWLLKESKRRNCYFLPVLCYSKRIQVWFQGRNGGSKRTFREPKKAFEFFDLQLNKFKVSWESVVVVWSHEWNQPKLDIQEEEACQPAKRTLTQVGQTEAIQKRLAVGE